MKHPTQDQLLNAAIMLDDAYPAVAAWLVRMAEQQAAGPLSFNCSAGCGACGVKLQDFVTHQTQAQEGDEWVVVDAEPQIVSACCGSPVEVWDERKKDIVARVEAAQQQAQPTQQPLTDEQKAVLLECRNQAMKWAGQAGIPECAAFGGIAQDLDWLCGQLGIAGSAAPTRQPLTDEQIGSAIKDWMGLSDPEDEPSVVEIARAIEAAHGITGSN